MSDHDLKMLRERVAELEAALATARRDALEEAAETCDGYRLRDPAGDGNGYWAADECAKTIRALAESKSGLQPCRRGGEMREDLVCECPGGRIDASFHFSCCPLAAAQNAPAVSVPVEPLVAAIARGWCTPENASKQMDVTLAYAIAAEVEKWIAAAQKCVAAAQKGEK